jgi:hypothetical protein
LDKNLETVEMLRTRFVPVAIDVIVMHSEAADPQERAFYDQVTAAILKNSARAGDGGLQGCYCFTAEGKVLGGQRLRFEKSWQDQLKAALKDFEAHKKNPKAVAVGEVPKTTAVSGRTVPAGALVVRVSKKVIGGYQKGPGTVTRPLVALKLQRLWRSFTRGPRDTTTSGFARTRWRNWSKADCRKA